MFCAGRVPEDDLKRTQMACGGSVQTTVHGLTDSALGTCEVFEEIQIGSERFNIFKGCPQAHTCTIILRGGAEQFMEETERSLHDAIMVVRRAVKNDAFVAGGGAAEMELSGYLRKEAFQIGGREQLLISAMARAFEVIPRQLCDNAGLDSTIILNQLRHNHAKGNIWYGVNIEKECVCDNFENGVWEPALVKSNSIISATEAACLLLSVDETIKNPESKGAEDNTPVRPPGMRH
uniref:SJCHGC04656 protein n=1 Tax=Schistosoma japonicum TaxID=6182 RepID=Q5DD73_SCHJA|nr:SJCHGC04656 protein [Schistosoma japonicum]